ncbi:hypothetical protein [Neisseria sp. HMSC069H12]|uniref:hypothetical protein n=1 Tax=Neisseria sp. HMSC069H12 TaxID=1739376 RepID=UPI0008A2A27A|nr:hypothetical protein [Neisseria sp. HMSC069H12]OFR66142.1 hypothetical protein HMPREF2872_11000 [Neisseria sp. HMSC069H12]
MTIIKNKKRHLLSCLTLCSAPLVSAQTQPDWSPIFKSFENGCQFDKRLENLLEPFSDVSDNWNDKDSKYQNLRLNHPNRVQLPKAYRDLAHPPMTLHRAEFSEDGEQFILDQTRLKLSGTYYGLPVVHISQTLQLETAGYSYTRLLLDVPLELARKVLKGKYRPVRKYSLILEEYETLQAKLKPINVNGRPQTILECAFING